MCGHDEGWYNHHTAIMTAYRFPKLQALDTKGKGRGEKGTIF